MSIQLSGPMLKPASGKAKNLMVLLHGYGSDGNDLIGLAKYWQTALPDFLFVAPNAPEKCPMNPTGYQWFDLDTNREMSRLTGSEKARPVLESFFEELWKQSKISSKDTFVVGFSQGAMMALDVGLRMDEAPLGIISFSGGLIGPDDWENKIKIKPPICLVHGEADDVVPVSMSINSRQRLEKIGIDCAMQIEPGLGHTISVEGLGFALAFIREVASNEVTSKKSD